MNPTLAKIDLSGVLVETAVVPIFGMPLPLCAPLGLAYLNASLRREGVRVQPRDLAARLWYQDNSLHKELFALSMPPAGGYYGVRLPVVLSALRPGGFPQFQDLGERIFATAEAFAQDSIADLVLIHTVDANIPFAAAYGQAMRRKGAVVVLGGPGMSLQRVRHLMLLTGATDMVVVGEGERVAIDVVRSVVTGEPWSKIRGVSCLLNGQLIENPPHPLANIHSIDWPNFDGMELYDCIPMLTSRGCIRDCSFCSEKSLWGNYRLRKVEDVISEMNHHVLGHGARQIFFHDDLLNGNPRWLLRFCEQLTSLGSPHRWDCYLEPYRLTPHLINKLAEAGCNYIRMGVEHLSPEMLRIMGRGENLEEIETALTWVADANINLYFDLIVGHPGETEAHHQENICQVRRILRDKPSLGVSVNPYCLLDGAPTGQHPGAYGIEISRWGNRVLPQHWEYLRPIVSQFVADHSQFPTQDVVRRRVRELITTIEDAGRRVNTPVG